MMTDAMREAMGIPDRARETTATAVKEPKESASELDTAGSNMNFQEMGEVEPVMQDQPVLRRSECI